MRKIKGLRWYMIALVTLGTVLGYLTRNTVAAAAPTLMEELHISTQQYSYIIAAYSAAYTVMQPVAGYVLDILGTKIGYAFFAIAWAVFCGSTALAGSWGGLALARGAVGAAEAAMIPAGLKASSEWFPAKERSIAVGYFNVGSSIGAMIAAAVGGMGDCHAQLADGVHHLRGIELRLGYRLAYLLQTPARPEKII